MSSNITTATTVPCDPIVEDSAADTSSSVVVPIFAVVGRGVDGSDEVIDLWGVLVMGDGGVVMSGPPEPGWALSAVDSGGPTRNCLSCNNTHKTSEFSSDVYSDIIQRVGAIMNGSYIFVVRLSVVTGIGW